MKDKPEMFDNKLDKKDMCHRVVMILFATAITIAVMVAAMIKVDISLHKERCHNSQLLMSSITSNIEDSMEKQWQNIEYFQNVFSRSSLKTIEEAEQLLQEIETDTSSYVCQVYLIDEDGFAYQSNGERFRWNNVEDLHSGNKSCSIDSSKVQAGDHGTYMIFLKPFDSAVKLDGRTITHMVMAVSVEFVDDFFNVQQFGDNSVSFILKSNGSQIYWQENDNPLSGVYNILNALEKAEFHYGETIENVRADIVGQESGCVRLKYEGTSYFLVYEPLSLNDWSAVMLIEQSSVASGTNGFVSTIAYSLILVAVVAVFFIVTLIIIATKNAKKRLLRAMEAERRANVAKTSFLSAMSHDIRTPMNAIVGMTTLALEKSSDEEYVKNCLSKVKVASNHLLTLINDILDISKVESGRMILSPTDVSLQEEANHLISIITPQINEKEQNFEFHTEELEVSNVHIDQLRLNQIMLNILSNAVKYTEVGGNIRVDMKSELLANGDRVLFTYIVKDNGMGMSAEFQKDMYTSFTRENNTPQRKIQGSGLGLAICKQMVDLMDGTITCKSEEGVGTTFTITIRMPVAKTQPEEVKNADSVINLEDLEGIRILIAEDNDFNWEVANEILSMHGILAERAENGQLCLDMLDKAEDGTYDLILMDIQMPIKNGYETAAEIRASKRKYLTEIPIVAMTADAFSEDIHRCLEVGMNAHLSKPVDINKLLVIVRNFRGGVQSLQRI